MLFAVVNWTAVGVIVGAVIAAAGGAAKLALRQGDIAREELAYKLDKIGAHLRSQDRQHDRLEERVSIEHRQMGERLSRLEASSGRVERAIKNGRTDGGHS